MLKTKINIILSVISILLMTSLFGVFVFAWFSNNHNVEATGIVITVAEPEVIDVDMTAYSFNLDTKAGIAVDTTTSFNMNDYQSVFTHLNVYNPLYIRLSVVGAKGKSQLDWSFSCASFNSESDYLEDDNQHLKNVLSNCVKIKCAYIPTSTISGSDTEANIWSKCNDYFKNVNNEQKFISGSLGSYTKTQKLDFYNINIDPNAEITYIYFEIDYDSPTVREILQFHSNGGNLSQDFYNVIDLTSDIGAIRMEDTR